MKIKDRQMRKSDDDPVCPACGAPLGWEGEREASDHLLAAADTRTEERERRIDLFSNALESAFRQMEQDQEAAFDPDREIIMTLIYRVLNPETPVQPID